MKIHIEDPYIREHLLDGEFGLEKEALRVTEDGRFAHTPHPFDDDDPYIVRDFCENQTEVNTGVHTTISGVIEELNKNTKRLQKMLIANKEYLWPSSNPPFIADETDIPVASFGGDFIEKTIYRNYLSGKYGRYKMTFSGIHVNYSFSDSLLKRDYALSGEDSFDSYRNSLYLNIAQGLVEYGWILVALIAASPLLDGSFLIQGREGETVFSGMASVRCSELGYWNDFTPVLDYGSVDAYAESIRRYTREGLIKAPSELYYPIRLKARGENDLDRLTDLGINHIELRMFDLNPFAPSGVDERDLFFAQLLILWISAHESRTLTGTDQVRAAANFKKAAHFDLTTVNYVGPDDRSMPFDEAGRILIEEMMDFYKDFPENVQQTLQFEYKKMTDKKNRYAHRILEECGNCFARKTLALAKERQVI